MCNTESEAEEEYFIVIGFVSASAVLVIIYSIYKPLDQNDDTDGFRTSYDGYTIYTLNLQGLLHRYLDQ